MGFFDKIDNSMIVDTFKQFLNRTDHEIFFHRYLANWHIPQEYALCAALMARYQASSLPRVSHGSSRPGGQVRSGHIVLNI